MPVLGDNFRAHFTWPGTYPVRRTRRWNCRLQGALTFWDDSGGKLHRPTVNAYLPEAMAQTGDVDNALRLIDKQIVQIERPGGRNVISTPSSCASMAGCSRSRATLRVPNAAISPRSAGHARQQAKTWEPRTSTSLALLWQSQGKRQDAYELLARIYDWFTEDFDTKDLLEAKALLTELE